MRVIYRARALRHLHQITAHISRDNPPAAARLMLRIEATVNHLADHPLLGRDGQMPGTRQLTIPGSDYLVIYRVAQGAVTILAVLHAARRIRS